MWAHVAVPTFYLSKSFELPKYWKSEIPHPSCPASNCSTFQMVDIFFHLYENPPVRHTCWTCFWYLQIFSCVYYDWILSIGKHVNFTNLGVSLWLSTFCIIFPTFFQTGISPFDGRSFQLVQPCVCVVYLQASR